MRKEGSQGSTKGSGMWGHWAHRVSRLEVEGQAFVFGCAGFYLWGQVDMAIVQ
jgi:hypothetical protein